jgi:hypothetical protein
MTVVVPADRPKKQERGLSHWRTEKVKTFLKGMGEKGSMNLNKTQ